MEILSIEMTPKGLEVRTTAPPAARIAEYATTRDDGFPSFSTLTVEISGAALAPGVAPSVRFRLGPFSSMRIVRYRADADCGIRLRLQPRYAADWRIEPSPNGIKIGVGRSQLFVQDTLAEATLAPTSLPGGVRIVGLFSATSPLTGRSAVSQVYLGVGQRLRSGANVRGFLAGLGSRSDNEPLFGAVAIDNIEVRNDRVADAAAGDLSIPLGDTGLSQGNYFSSILIRGVSGGIASDRSRLSVFGGRAASGQLLRLSNFGQLTSPLTHDHVIGSQWTVRASEKVGVGLAWTRSLPRGEASQNNLYQSVEWMPRLTHSIRATLEESFPANGPTGVALTVDPRFEGKRLQVSGYYRYTSGDFRPALASTIFANLRRSYGLAGSFDATDRLNLHASASQAKRFSLFDPNDVGTFQSSRSAGATYRLTDESSVFADYGTSDVHTDPGSILPADSRLVTRSIGYSRSFGKFNSTIRYADEHTENRLNHLLDLRSRRLEGTLTESLHDGGLLSGRASVASSRRVHDGSAGSDYSASLSYRSPMTAHGRYRAAIGITQVPAGFALTSSRQEFVSVGYEPAPGSAYFDGGIDVTYYFLQTGNGQRRHVWSVLLNATRLVDWGVGLLPEIPYANRALTVRSMFAREDAGELFLRVFEDRNANGTREPDEPWLPDAVIRVDERDFRTGGEGRGARARIDRGPHIVRVAPQAALIDEYIAVPEQRVRVTDSPVAVEIPARPAGRVVGKVSAFNELERGALENIRIVARGNGLEFETLTDAEGAFRLGPLPVGDYTVELDTTSLTPETRAAGETAVLLHLTKGAHAEVSFNVRKATARERIAAP